MAPPADQDATAAYYVNEILADYDGRIEIIPVAWYLPSAIDNDARMDVVPAMGANTLTPRQYQAKWMARYELERERASLAPTAPTITTAASDATGLSEHHRPAPPSPAAASAAPSRRSVVTGRCPAPKPASTPTRPGSTAPTTTTPRGTGSSLPTPPSTPCEADESTASPTGRTTGGAQGCGESGRPGCVSCGVGVTIVDDTGYRWTYCHGNSLTVTLGDDCHRRSTTSVVRQHRPLRHRPPPPRDPHQRDPALPPAAHQIPLRPQRRYRSRHPAHDWMQLLMDQPISINDVRVAVSDLTDALLNRQPLSDQQWDRAITALHIAREQHGGRIRHLIHVILDAGHHHTTGHLADALTETPLPPRHRRRPAASPAGTPPPPAAPNMARSHPTRAVQHRHAQRPTIRPMTASPLDIPPRRYPGGRS